MSRARLRSGEAEGRGTRERGSPPVDARPLLADLLGELVRLLRGLDEQAWDRPTSAGEWRVRDVAAHLLDLDIRRLAAGRDGYPPPPPQEPLVDESALVAYLDALNAEWVKAARRISPPLLVDFLEVAGAQAARHLASLDPFAAALYPVAWAGEERSENWFDVGREYVERWHHQDQVRDAVGEPPLTDGRWLKPVLDLSLLCLPHAYRDVRAEPGTAVRLRISGESGGEWTLQRGTEAWTLRRPMEGRSEAGLEGGAVACELELEAPHAARLLLRGRGGDLRTGEETLRAAGVTVRGDARLAAAFLDARALMV